MIKNYLRKIYISNIISPLINLLGFPWKGKGAILVYHRVVKDEQIEEALELGLTVSCSNFERHITELAKIRDEARIKGAWSAATNAEVARGKAAGLYVDQKLILSGNLDQLSEKELESRMKQILDDHKVLIDGVAIEATNEKNNLNKLPPT